MKKENLSDALHFLDENMLAETDRMRKSKTGRKKMWLRQSAVAAVLCLLVGGLLLFVRETVWNNGQSIEEQSKLPLLYVSYDMQSGGMGFEGILNYDLEEINEYNPWREENAPKTLPVFENGSYDPAGMPRGMTEEEMLEKLYTVAETLDMEVQELTYEREADFVRDGDKEKVVSITATVKEGNVRVEAQGQVNIYYEERVVLPEDYNFGKETATQEEAEEGLSYLIERYCELLDFEEPQKAFAFNYYFDGTLNRNAYVYEGSGDVVSDILHYTFEEVDFVVDEEGLWMIRINDRLACANKLGDYPIITVMEAKELLLQGSYATSVPYEIPGDEYIARVELVYRNHITEEIFLPYYRFYVELPKEQQENGLKCYGAYYVPAVEGSYLAEMPVYDGGF